MSEKPKLVDFSKRDITLPQGFKDLHQVLTASAGMVEGISREPRHGVRHGGARVAAFSEIPKHIRRAFQTKAHSFFLMIITINQHLSVGVVRSGDETPQAHVNVSRDSKREEFVERFLQQRLPATKLRSIQGPFHIHFPILPLPDAEEFARFTNDLFSAFNAMSSERRLEFRYDELV